MTDISVRRNKAKVREQEHAFLCMHVCVCLHQRRQLSTMGQRICQSQSKGKWKAVQRGRKGPLCVPNLWTGCGPRSAGGWGVVWSWDVSDLGNEGWGSLHSIGDLFTNWEIAGVTNLIKQDHYSYQAIVVSQNNYDIISYHIVFHRFFDWVMGTFHMRKIKATRCRADVDWRTFSRVGTARVCRLPALSLACWLSDTFLQHLVCPQPGSSLVQPFAVSNNLSLQCRSRTLQIVSWSSARPGPQGLDALIILISGANRQELLFRNAAEDIQANQWWCGLCPNAYR